MKQLVMGFSGSKKEFTHQLQIMSILLVIRPDITLKEMSDLLSKD